MNVAVLLKGKILLWNKVKCGFIMTLAEHVSHILINISYQNNTNH